MAVQVTIYTDGSALGNPGKGGYGVVLLSGPYRKELSQGYRLTTVSDLFARKGIVPQTGSVWDCIK